ncbi:MAG: 50S ribosomal protein L15 [Spirochaetaceae bacterium]|nr:50S ribosomal protein L15 [Spirochaetaceae bacterium]
MSDFNLIAPKGANKKKKIVGRGSSSGHGTTSGRGNKGQQARSGGKTYTGFEGGQMPLYRRVAKRGFSNYPFKKEIAVVNLVQLEHKFESGEQVDLNSLKGKNLLKNSCTCFKILANGDVSKNLTVQLSKSDAISDSAKAKIEKAGGTVISL